MNTNKNNWFDQLFPVRTKPMSTWPHGDTQEDRDDGGDAGSPVDIPWTPHNAPAEALELVTA
jgi:hypothetical protein